MKFLIVGANIHKGKSVVVVDDVVVVVVVESVNRWTKV
jgi:hypothetical protein